MYRVLSAAYRRAYVLKINILGCAGGTAASGVRSVGSNLMEYAETRSRKFVAARSRQDALDKPVRNAKNLLV